jgi:hypothetical protein
VTPASKLDAMAEKLKLAEDVAHAIDSLLSEVSIEEQACAYNAYWILKDKLRAWREGKSP